MKDNERVHLFRGAAPVRMWSRYQKTDEEWTLCGIHRISVNHARHCTENAAQVKCSFCRQLMHTGSKRALEKAKKASLAHPSRRRSSLKSPAECQETAFLMMTATLTLDATLLQPRRILRAEPDPVGIGFYLQLECGHSPVVPGAADRH